jgi:hypothetical protein
MPAFNQFFHRRSLSLSIFKTNARSRSNRHAAKSLAKLAIDQLERRLALAVTPGAPMGVITTAGANQVGLVWTPPTSNGGTALTDYRVEWKSASTTVTTWNLFNDGVSTGTTATVTGLTNGTAYVFRVAAINALGAGTPSAASLSATPGTVPNVPTNLVVVNGNAAVNLSWTAPANGGSAILDYAIQQSVDGGANWTTVADGVSTSTTYRVSGLTNGTSYVFRVAAVNAFGQGTPTAASGPVTPNVAPGMPTNVVATPGNTQVRLSWAAPPSNGGTALTDYRVEWKSASTTVTTWNLFNDGVSTGTTATVTGLTNGTAYVFRVAAINALGAGTPSEISLAVKPNASGFVQPNAPLFVVGTSGNAQVSLSWSAGATGGTAITSYIVQYSSNSGGSWTTFSSAITTRATDVTGLVNGTPYVFRVAANNAIGTSDFSSVSTPVVPATVPFMAGMLTVRQGAFKDQVILRWSNPTAANTGGSPVTGFTIQYSLDGGNVWRLWDNALPRTGSFSEYTANGLEIGKQIWFRVAAVNKVGTGNWISSVGITPIG